MTTTPYGLAEHNISLGFVCVSVCTSEERCARDGRERRRRQRAWTRKRRPVIPSTVDLFPRRRQPFRGARGGLSGGGPEDLRAIDCPTDPKDPIGRRRWRKSGIRAFGVPRKYWFSEYIGVLRRGGEPSPQTHRTERTRVPVWVWVVGSSMLEFHERFLETAPRRSFTHF